MPSRRSLSLAVTALSALVLAACADGTEEDTAPDALPDDGAVEEGELDLDDLFGGEDGMPDPNEHVQDGVFRAEGIVLPIPEGFELEPMAFMQGLVAAVTPDGLKQVAAQAVVIETLPEPLDIDGLAEANTQEFGQPSLDEEADVDGATRARQLRYDDIPSGQEGQPDLTLQLIIAEDGAGELAIFNYVAPTADFDAAEADAVLAGVGFDPDSSPPSPEPLPEQ